MDMPNVTDVFPWVAAVAGLFLGSLCALVVRHHLRVVPAPFVGCPVCHGMTDWSANIPLWSHVVRRGRCDGCGAALSLRRPVLEILCAGLSALLALRCGPGLGWLALTGLVAVFLALSVIDWNSYLLPDVLVFPGVGLGLAAGYLGMHRPMAECLLGAGTGMGLFWLLRALYRHRTGREGLGLGDVKLMAAIGAVTGVAGLPAAVLLGAGSALPYCLGLLLARKGGLGGQIDRHQPGRGPPRPRRPGGVHGRGQRRGNSRAGPGRHLRALHPGGQLPDAGQPWRGPGPGHRQAPGRPLGREHHHAQHPGPGHHRDRSPAPD